MRIGDASFARSFDPCTSILTMHCDESHGGGADELASRLGKLGQPRGTNTGVGSTDEARLATYHRLRKEKGVMRQRKGRRSRSPSLRVSGAGNINGLVARTSLVQLQKSVGDNWSRISSANALQKEWQG